MRGVFIRGHPGYIPVKLNSQITGGAGYWRYVVCTQSPLGYVGVNHIERRDHISWTPFPIFLLLLTPCCTPEIFLLFHLMSGGKSAGERPENTYFLLCICVGG